MILLGLSNKSLVHIDYNNDMNTTDAKQHTKNYYVPINDNKLNTNDAKETHKQTMPKNRLTVLHNSNETKQHIKITMCLLTTMKQIQMMQKKHTNK